MEHQRSRHANQSTPDPQQNQMAEAFRNFQQCIQHCQKAVFFTDAAGILKRVNPAFEKLTGYASSESVGKDLSWMAAEGPTSESYRRIWQEIFGNRAFRGIVQIRKRDGSSVQMELTAVPVRDTKGQIASLVCTGRDVTEDRAAEAKLGEARRLNAIGMLARAVAHDLSNMLMVISGTAELALDGLAPDHPLWRQLQDIKSASERACDLGREMIAFGCSDSRDPTPVSINSVVQETCRFLPHILGQDVQLQVVLGPEIGKVEIDIRQFQQALLMFAMNARDALPEGGKLITETKLVDLDAGRLADTDLAPGKYVALTIAAEKPGLVAETVADRAQSGDSPGNGSWIQPSEFALVEEIAKQAHGFVIEAGTPNQTTFNIYLPVLADKSEQPKVREIVGGQQRARAAGAGGD